MALSLAVLRVLEREGGFELADQAAVVAGHSLGEYSALAAAGAFDPARGRAAAAPRGQAMQQAVPPGDGAMAALLGVEMDLAGAICAEAAEGAGRPEVVETANDNGGGQVVISGHKAAVERAMALAKAKGVRRAMLLPVSAPFHCALMAPAADVMAEALAKIAAGAAAGAAGGQCLGRQGHRSGRDRGLLVRAGDRHRALARVRADDDGAGRGQLHRTRRRQGAVRPGQAHRPGRRRASRSARPAEIEAFAEDPSRKTIAMFRLDGKTALVTGASGGIGGAIARALHAPGRDGGARPDTRREGWKRWRPSSASGAQFARPICAIRRRRDALVAAAEAAAGPLDILVNNAGLTRDMLALRMKDEDWQTVLDVDLTAPFRLARAALEGHVAPPRRADRHRSPRSSGPPAIRARPTTRPPRPGSPA